MRALILIGVMCAVAASAGAQPDAVVYNAAAYPTGLSGDFSAANVHSIVLAPVAVGVFFVPGAPLNTVSPRMRAILVLNNLAQVTLSLPLTQTATLSIRPVGSSSLLPVNVISAVGNIVTFVVPAGAPTGAAQLSYSIDGGPAQWTSLTIVQSSFAFFLNSNSGQAIAQTVSPSGALNPIGLATPAQPGQLMQLTGSGLGYGNQVNITVGGLPAALSYAGPHPTQAGIDQILFQVPSGLSYGCYVPVTLTYNQASVTTSMSATVDGSPCKHPYGLSLSDEKTLDAGGSIFAGEIGVSSQFSGATSNSVYREDSASVNVASWNANSLSTFTPPGNPGCSLNAFEIWFANAISGFFNAPPSLPDLGATLTLSNAATALTFTSSYGFYSSFDQQNAGTLANPPAPMIPGGNWTWQSSGSADLPPSSFNFNLPAPLQIGGGAPLALRRDQDQTITWNGSNFDASALVGVSLSGHAADGTLVSLSCSAAGNSGSFTIPAALLSQFAVSSMGTLYLNVYESAAALPHARFTLTNGQTLLMIVSYSGSDNRPVDFQ